MEHVYVEESNIKQLLLKHRSYMTNTIMKILKGPKNIASPPLLCIPITYSRTYYYPPTHLPTYLLTYMHACMDSHMHAYRITTRQVPWMVCIQFGLRSFIVHPPNLYVGGFGNCDFHVRGLGKTYHMLQDCMVDSFELGQPWTWSSRAFHVKLGMENTKHIVLRILPPPISYTLQNPQYQPP